MSTTPGERKALLFLGTVALLGAAVQLRPGDAALAPSPAELSALERQIGATDSAASADDAKRAPRSKRAPRRPPAADLRPQPEPLPSAAPPPTLRSAQGRLPNAQPPTPLDVDRATAAELEALPGVGPALAARIVAERERSGGFGSLAGLDRVRGVGPALLEQVAPLVTFSAPSRPPGEDHPASPRHEDGARETRRVRRARRVAIP